MRPKYLTGEWEDSGGRWLCYKYILRLDDRPTTVETVKKGILYHVPELADLLSFEWKDVTDHDIWEIILSIHTDHSDEARRSLLKLYTYETPFYTVLNKALQEKDEKAVETLGPYSMLLHIIMFVGGGENLDEL